MSPLLQFGRQLPRPKGNQLASSGRVIELAVRSPAPWQRIAASDADTQTAILEKHTLENQHGILGYSTSITAYADMGES